MIIPDARLTALRDEAVKSVLEDTRTIAHFRDVEDHPFIIRGMCYNLGVIDTIDKIRLNGEFQALPVAKRQGLTRNFERRVLQ